MKDINDELRSYLVFILLQNIPDLKFNDISITMLIFDFKHINFLDTNEIFKKDKWLHIISFFMNDYSTVDFMIWMIIPIKTRHANIFQNLKPWQKQNISLLKGWPRYWNKAFLSICAFKTDRRMCSESRSGWMFTLPSLI